MQARAATQRLATGLGRVAIGPVLSMARPMSARAFHAAVVPLGIHMSCLHEHERSLRASCQVAANLRKHARNKGHRTIVAE